VIYSRKSILNFLQKKLKRSQPSIENYVFDLNTKYDLQTFKIINELLRGDSNAIDIGAHKGQILKKIIEASPNGTHFAFEPLPELSQNLHKQYKNSTTVFPFALSDFDGVSNFNYVITNPAYSGLIKRKYDRPEMDTTIQVPVRKLDNVIPKDVPIHFIKIDVEGGEYAVLKGASELLKKWKPVMIYEQGLGGSDINGTGPEEFYDFLCSFGYHISLMEYYLLKKEPLSKEEYAQQFRKGYNYYFIAY